MSRVSPQLIVFSYHKTGTTLFLHIMTKICQTFGFTLANHYGLLQHLEHEADVVLLPHSQLARSLFDSPLDRPFRAIRMIRDPRDIWVSGYLYHRRCVEEWCVNTDLDTTPPILWPKVDHSVAHRPEAWKRDFLERLGGRSYQQNLLDRSPADGLDFELQGYTGWTLEAMREWKQTGVEALDVKLEDVMTDFDGSMRRIFAWFGFTARETTAALEVARSEDVQRMDDAAIAERAQISSRVISKWRDFLPARQVVEFEATYGDLIRDLGYPMATAEVTRELQTTRDAGIRLSTRCTSIRPTDARHGTYIFVVPSGSDRVWLESRRGVPSGPDAPVSDHDPNLVRLVGLRVSEIVIRSDGGVDVIAADDPKLSAGWYEAESSGNEIWRWTDGAGELPWGGVRGHAVVTVRCETLAEYPAGP